jgi:CheY-like chemotaxis protein
LPDPEAETAEESDDTSWMLEEQERRITPPRSILWVDDHPENNAMLAESWRRDGAQVDIARSTSEALRRLEYHAYGLIISNMGRRESGEDVPDAGFQLLVKVRTADPITPFVLYTSFSQASRVTRVLEAEAAGASLVTDSTFELTRFASGLGILDGA